MSFAFGQGGRYEIVVYVAKETPSLVQFVIVCVISSVKSQRLEKLLAEPDVRTI